MRSIDHSVQNRWMASSAVQEPVWDVASLVSVPRERWKSLQGSRMSVCLRLQNQAETQKLL